MLQHHTLTDALVECTPPQGYIRCDVQRPSDVCVVATVLSSQIARFAAVATLTGWVALPQVLALAEEVALSAASGLSPDAVTRPVLLLALAAETSPGR